MFIYNLSCADKKLNCLSGIFRIKQILDNCLPIIIIQEPVVITKMIGDKMALVNAATMTYDAFQEP